MLTKLNLYQLHCDACGLLGQSFIAAKDEESAPLPPGWIRKEDGESATHLCAPCDGREWPEEIHFH